MFLDRLIAAVYVQSDVPRRILSGTAPMRFVIYMIGFLILIGGLAWAAITAGAPSLYVVIGAVILLGLGIITGVSRASHRSGADVTVVRDKDRL